eukprot:m.79413 g.79413  ORF g.79413 m.79413 type:complete len:460 (+) comp9288_c1_seq2:277-1656(+)
MPPTDPTRETPILPPGIPQTAEYRRIQGIKARLGRLNARAHAVRAEEARLAAERHALEADIAVASRELERAVHTPPPSGHDPTASLPDEVMVHILLLLPFAMLWEGRCSLVCRRWRNLVQTAPVRRRKREGRWEAYAHNWIRPKTIGESGAYGAVRALAVGKDTTMFSGSADGVVRAWSGANGVLLRTMRGHEAEVRALAVDTDGTVFSGSYDRTIKVWSGTDGTLVRTMAGHTDKVKSIVLGHRHRRLYSGSDDGTIRVWSRDHGTLIRTLQGHASAVRALAIGANGDVYSASTDATIRIWSGDTCDHITTLDGHWVVSLAVGPQGNVYAGSADDTIHVWSGHDGRPLTTLTGHTNNIVAIACGPDGRVFSAAWDNTLRVWPAHDSAEDQDDAEESGGGSGSTSSRNETHIRRPDRRKHHGFYCPLELALPNVRAHALACGPDGKVYSASYAGTIQVW